MTYHLRAANGKRINAAVEIDEGIIRLHSRGGATGGRPERNPGYSAALNAILERLYPQETLIKRIILDSRDVRKTNDTVVLAEPGDFKRLPVRQVAAQIRRRMRDHGRDADAKPNGGNSTKAVLFHVTVGQNELVRRLLADDVNTAEVPTSDGGGADLIEQPANYETDATMDDALEPFQQFQGKDADEPNGTVPPSDDDRSWAEGNLKRVQHLRRERAPGLANKKRSDFKARYGQLRCEQCGLIPSQSLGEHGDAVIEVHHELPVSQMPLGHETRLDDLKCLCANCHRIVHRQMARSSS